MTGQSRTERAVVALQTFEWLDDRTNTVTYFDVTAGWERVRTRPAEADQVTVVPVDIHFAKILTGDVTVTWTHVAEVDPSNPGLVGSWHGGMILIDGWHRLARARAWGWQGFPAYVLDEQETAELIFDANDPGQVSEHALAAWIAACVRPDPDLETEAEWRLLKP